MGKEIKFKNLTITEDQRTFHKSFGGEHFSVRIPLPYERAQISTLTSKALGGQDLKSFEESEVNYIRMIITLNSCIVGKPDWWEGADKCPDDDLLLEIWKFYCDSESEFQDSLKKNTGNKNMEGK